MVNNEDLDYVDGSTPLYVPSPNVNYVTCSILNNTDTTRFGLRHCDTFALFRQNVTFYLATFLIFTFNIHSESDNTPSNVKQWITLTKSIIDCEGLGLIGPGIVTLTLDNRLSHYTRRLCWHAIFHDLFGRFYQSTHKGPGYRYSNSSSKLNHRSSSLRGHIDGINSCFQLSLPSLQRLSHSRQSLATLQVLCKITYNFAKSDSSLREQITSFTTLWDNWLQHTNTLL